MSTTHPNSPFLAIIIRYHQPLERYARRLTVHKHRAPDIVKWAIESLYDQGLLHEGPQLRANLVKQTRSMARGLNRAVAIYNHMQAQGRLHNPGHAAPTNPLTGQ